MVARRGKKLANPGGFFALKILGLCLLIYFSGGCGRSGSSGTSGVSRSEESVARFDVGPLPELGDSLPLLDGGRLEISPPKAWVVSPRSTQYLVRFQSESGNPYPSVLVTAQDSPKFKQLTVDNLETFARSVAAELEAAGVKTTVKVGRIGSHLGVMYTRRARVKDALGGIVERLFFETVAGGRRYQFELRTPPETLSLAEPFFLAIVRGAKISAVGDLEDQPEEPEAQSVADKSAQPEAAREATAQGAGPVSQGTAEQAAQPAPVSAASTDDSGKPGQEKMAVGEPSGEPVAEEKTGQPPADKPENTPASNSKPETPKKGKSAEDLLKDVDALLK